MICYHDLNHYCFFCVMVFLHYPRRSHLRDRFELTDPIFTFMCANKEKIASFKKISPRERWTLENSLTKDLISFLKSRKDMKCQCCNEQEEGK